MSRRTFSYPAVVVTGALLVVVANRESFAQVSVSGLLDYVVFDATSEDVTNLTFRRFSNFNSLRTRLFIDAAPAENVEVFSQILIDGSSFQLYGAYARLSRIAGTDFNLQLGLIPGTVGAWGPRTYSDQNPLIGVPLLYNFHTAFNPGGPDSIRSVAELLAARDTRSSSGLPLIYDACWNTGVELYRVDGKLTYSIGLLSGSVGKPSTTQKKNTPQVTTHITYAFEPGLVVGYSGFAGPYLAEGDFRDSLPTGTDETDLINAGAGVEVYYASRYFEARSEAFYSFWEHPYLEDLSLVSGFVEGKYKFTPGWYLAGRVGLVEPGKLTAANGQRVRWDYPVKRFEGGIGYHPNRMTVIKLVAQINRFDFTDTFDSELYALQFSVAFE